MRRTETSQNPSEKAAIVGQSMLGAVSDVIGLMAMN